MMYQAVGDGFAVFASKGGAPTNPDWYHNLVANPQVRAEIGTETGRVHRPGGRRADARADLGRAEAAYPGFADYEPKTTQADPGRHPGAGPVAGLPISGRHPAVGVQDQVPEAVGVDGHGHLGVALAGRRRRSR